ncbi:MAG TPA: hypothetical protein VE869_17315 [Gemmatimonas sp.]|nr:hypothetical protein [Gemmatimonas sp.]
MGMLNEWRAGRERRRRSATYLVALLQAPSPSDVEWLSRLSGNASTAAQELMFARRAIGLIVAERDALDDRTASDVAHQLADVVVREARDAPARGRAWAERWRAYTGALAVRGETDAPATRLARVLLAGAGLESPGADAMARATLYVSSTRTQANEALRAVFGVASLPEDVRPSAIRL